MSTNNGGPAFPIMPPVDSSDQLATGYPMPDTSMSLRDYFAARAMQSLLTVTDLTPEQIAQGAFVVADAMLAERDKGAA